MRATKLTTRGAVLLVLMGLTAACPNLARAIDPARRGENRKSDPEPEGRVGEPRTLGRGEPAERTRGFGEPAERTREYADGPETRLLPGRPRTRWYIGLSVENLETGVRVVRVVPDSPAWRVGLERRDRIVSVNGFQVGIVASRPFPLQDELQIRANRYGRVLLLVQDHRSGELVNVAIQLEREGGPRPEFPQPPPTELAGIQGRVEFRTAILPNREAVLVVSLVDLLRPLSSVRPFAETRVPVRRGNSANFLLRVDKNSLPRSGRYGLRARLLVNNRMVEANDPSQYSIRNIDPRSVKIKLTPVRFDKQR